MGIFSCFLLIFKKMIDLKGCRKSWVQQGFFPIHHLWCWLILTTSIFAANLKKPISSPLPACPRPKMLLYHFSFHLGDIQEMDTSSHILGLFILYRATLGQLRWSQKGEPIFIRFWIFFANTLKCEEGAGTLIILHDWI